MRLLHVSDWHLGRVTYNCSRAPDHDAVIQEIVGLAKDFRPHVICHTGDLFDSPRPSYMDLARGIDALLTLSSVAPVVVLCGNHDSPALFRLFATLLGQAARIHFIDKARPPDRGGILELPGDGEEMIRLAPLPFVHANRLVEHFEDPSTWMATYADRIHVIESALGRGLADGYDPSRHVLVFAAHLHVTGAVFSKSERPLHVTDTYASRLEVIPSVSYAAFGHIHRPQALPGTVLTGRYAGSPIPLDFGEEGEDKTVVLVEAQPGRPATVSPQPLSGGRRLLRLSGTLEELEAIAPSVGRALCLVTVRTERPTADLEDRVRELLPDAVILQVAEDYPARRLAVIGPSGPSGDVEPTFAEMFRAYLVEHGTRGPEAGNVMRTFESLIRAVQEEEEVSFPEVGLLEGVPQEATP